MATPGNGYVHPSLASSSQTSCVPRKSGTPRSVNDYLQHLRRAQSSTKNIKDLSSSRYATSGRPPKVAGPPPPHSWTVGDVDGAQSNPTEKPSCHKSDRYPPSPGSMPGGNLPQRRSLLHQVLMATAVNIEWHTEYDHEYLSLLPLEVRYQLLEYVGLYGSTQGISLRSIRTIFADANAAATYGSDVQRLDLTGSVGRNLPLKHLISAWSRRAVTTPNNLVLDSWEEAPEEEPVRISNLSLDCGLCFPNLTHLSLSRPSQAVSWDELLYLSRYLGSITHLALDHWPRPQLPDLEDESRTIRLRDKDDEAAYVMNILSKNTPSLVWLSLACCQDWINDLWPSAHRPDTATSGTGGMHRSVAQARSIRSRSRVRSAWADGTSHVSKQSIDNRGTSGPDWAGTWSKVQHVNVSQEWLPLGLRANELRWLLKMRSSTEDFANHHFTFAPLAREPESYRVIAPTSEIQRSIDGRRATNQWLSGVYKAAELASKVRRLRRLLGQLPCHFEYGWHKQEALDAGYDEQCLIEAGF